MDGSQASQGRRTQAGLSPGLLRRRQWIQLAQIILHTSARPLERPFWALPRNRYRCSPHVTSCMLLSFLFVDKCLWPNTGRGTSGDHLMLPSHPVSSSQYPESTCSESNLQGAQTNHPVLPPSHKTQALCVSLQHCNLSTSGCFLRGNGGGGERLGEGQRKQ